MDLFDRDRRLDHVLECREVRKEVEVLKDQSDAQPHAVDQIVLRPHRQLRLRRATDVDVADPDVPFVKLLEPIETPEHRRLATARRSENRGELPLLDAECGSIQYGFPPIALDNLHNLDHAVCSSIVCRD